ncbi:MAG: hypothetical protein OEV64_09960, partial [Desulfobulbaceae bacterium]|nr:hypothetical protein [Desulfobulbaceae bacterium]
MNSSRFVALITLGATLALLWGCGPKTVAPYSAPVDSTMPEGKDFQYPNVDSSMNTEDMRPSMETLDTSTNPVTDPSTTFSQAADQQDDEYKKLHGRTSPQLKP